MLNVNYICKDRHFQDAMITYWFEINGIDYGTEILFDTEILGIVVCNGDVSVVDANNYPEQNEFIATIALRECKITDEMIG